MSSQLELVVPKGGEANGWQVGDRKYRYLLGRRWGQGRGSCG